MEKLKVRCSQQTSQQTGPARGSRRATPGAGLIEAIAVTAEICGQALSPVAAEVLAADLAAFDETAILAALARCRMELQGPLKTAEILARLDDGRPDGDEAWNMMPRDETASVVWTDEMAYGWGLALPLLEAGDVGAARTAFLEAYAKTVLDARIRRRPARWMPSLGSDVAGRERVLLEAVRKRRLSAAHAEKLLPPGSDAPAADDVVARVTIRNLH